MHIKPKTKNLKLILVLVPSVLVVGVAGLAFLIYVKNKEVNHDQSTVDDRPANSVDYGPPTTAEVRDAQRQKDERVKQAEDAKDQDSSIVVGIVRADQVSAGQSLNVRANITGVQQGTCEVSLTKDGAVSIVKTFEVFFEATQSRCVAADVPAADFSVSGEWDLKLIVKSGDRQSKPVTQKVEIKK